MPLGSEDAAEFRDRRTWLQILLPAVNDILFLSFNFLICKMGRLMSIPQRGCKKQFTPSSWHTVITPWIIKTILHSQSGRKKPPCHLPNSQVGLDKKWETAGAKSPRQIRACHVPGTAKRSVFITVLGGGGVWEQVTVNEVRGDPGTRTYIQEFPNPAAH